MGNKIKKIYKNKFLNFTENSGISNDINTRNEITKREILEDLIKNSNNLLISNSINYSISNYFSNSKNKITNNKKSILHFKYNKDIKNNSFDIELNISKDNNNLKSNKSQIILPLFKREEKENYNELRKKITQIEIISKPGEPIFGQTKINQDNYFCKDLINGYKFIGVCDGHGEYGHYVSDFVKQNLSKELNDQIRQMNIFENILINFKDTNTNSNKKILFKKLKEILNKSFILTNNKLLSKNNANNYNLKLSGSTCISILMDTNNLNKLYISNVGDSRALIIKEMKYKYWTCQQLSRDHKPIEKDESTRIYKCGGEIQKMEDDDGGWTGPLRVWVKNGDGPGLAMTRSFGDILGSSIGVICIPEINEYTIKKEDKAIIIASDGLWEYVSNKETTNIVKKVYNKKEPNIIVNQLYKEAYKKWKNKDKGIDDITIICVILNSS